MIIYQSRTGTKRNLAAFRAHGYSLAKTWSCYEPKGAKPCGTCDACRLRLDAEAP